MIDIIVYRAGFSTQKTGYYAVHKKLGRVPSEGILTKRQLMDRFKIDRLKFKDAKLYKHNSIGTEEVACGVAGRIVKKILNDLNTKDYCLYLTSTDKSNYRFEAATIKPYKGNRTAPKPVHYDTIRSYLIDVWDAVVISGKEADDALGEAQTAPEASTIICSIDKDLDMIPGLHYDIEAGEVYETTDPGHLELVGAGKKKKLRGGGKLWFFAQILLGDSADNIPGVVGFGPVKVHSTLSKLKTDQEAVDLLIEIYEKAFKLDVLDAYKRLNEIMTLLWIRRHGMEAFPLEEYVI